ncbi:hypothetical protein DYB31_009303 [Aphanomyces astaci]|uniref:DNA polymerase delta subunit 3 n=1 Tax=Aphanomyces astaci TaxID=112090 RepID=A0A397FVS6_APHAT|nr:hypothetical protein DYB31_009303 [Aphanomyces astaci]
MAQILTQEKDVQSVHVVVSTVINPETNTIAGKTISLVRGGDPDDETDLYAVYRSTESSSGRVDDALKNIMWFPRLDEGLGGTIASDIACDAASCGARNLVLKAAESASVFSNFKSTGTTKSTPFTRPSSSSASSKAPPKKQSTPFFAPIQSSQPNEVADEDKPIHPPPPQKRQKAVSTTRINEQGYMVTETTYEDVEDDDDLPPPPPQAKPSSGKLPAPPPKKKRVVKASGSAKQSNLMDFFGKK